MKRIKNEGAGALSDLSVKPWVFYSFFCLLALILAPQDVWAYRPFESENADIVDRGKFEIETGFRLLNEGRSEKIYFPEADVDYGLTSNWEISMSGFLQIYDEEERNLEKIDPRLLVKGLLREGSLQDKEGPSLAVEGGVLLPSTRENERSFGLRAAGIASYEFAGFMSHTNVGLEQDREDFKSNLIWGTILEFPAQAKIRFVSELNGKIRYNDRPENSALIGCILDMQVYQLDIGARKGLSESSPDWELTTGVTVNL